MTITDWEVIADRYVSVTPAGAYYAVESKEPDLYRQVLLNLLQINTTPRLDEAMACRLSGLAAPEAMQVFARLEAAQLVRGNAVPEDLPQGQLEAILPPLLARLSDRGNALLTDLQRGFFLDYTGYSQTQAEDLAVFASGLLRVYERHSGTLREDLGIASRGLAIVDPGGNSELGVWPLYVGDNEFALIVPGIVQLTHQAFRQVVWLLVQRYGNNN